MAATHQLENLMFEAEDEILSSLTEENWNKINSGLLTEEEINEILGFTRKKTLIKKIKEKDPQANEKELQGMSKGELKKLLKQKREDAGEDTRGFFAKTADRVKGIKDIGMFSNKAGTLLGGTETFDIKQRKAAKSKAKKEIEGWLGQLEYEPLSKIYDDMVSAGFPNKANKSGFKGEAQKFQQLYDDVVEAHKNEQLDAKTANAIIAVLRGVVIYFQDFAMSDQYFYRESREESLADLIFEQEEEKEEKSIGRKEGDVSANFEAAYGMKLPLGLLATGAACMALGFAADSPFVQDFLGGMKDMKKIQKGGGVIKSTVVKSVPLGEVKSGEGIIKVTRRMVPGAEKFGLPGGPSMAEVFGGGKNAAVLKLIKASMISSKGPGAIDQLISSNANPQTAFVSGPTSGTAKVGEELFGIDKGQFHTNLTQTIEENLPTEEVLIEDDTSRNKILNALMKWAGPALKGLGLGFLAAGAASGFMRWKGKGGKKGSGMVRGSRMSILKVMVDGFKDVGKPSQEPREEDDSPEDSPEGQVEIVIDLESTGFVIKMVDAESGEEVSPDELELDVEGIVPNLPLLAELGITTPESIALLLSEAHTGTFVFKGGQKYPDGEGKFGSTSKNMESYPTLSKLLAALIKRAHPEMGDISQKNIDSAISGNTFTLNDKRGDNKDVVVGPGDQTGGDETGDKPEETPGDKPEKKGKPRLGLIRLDDDGLKLYRTRGNLGDKKYDAAKSQFQQAQDNAFTGRGTSPSVEDIEGDHKRQRRTPPASSMTYSQMVGRKGVRGKDLKPGVEMEPYFTLDKSAHSDLYTRRRKSKSIDGVGKVDLPMLGKDAKNRSEQLLKKVFDKFVSGKKKLTRRQANQIVMDYIGRGKKSKGFKYDKETRDKVVQVMVGYGLVQESADQSEEVITESKTATVDLTLTRWEVLAGIGEEK